MNSISKIDLHMHTCISDGTDSPEELLDRIRVSRITYFSITDHDAVQAGTLLPKLLQEGDPCFFSGVEFSCKDEHGSYHILGYGYDPDAAQIRKVTQHGHSLRMKKLEARLDFLKTSFGVELPEQDIAALHAMHNPGKPHLGNLLVKAGYAQTKDQAIKDYLNHARIASEYIRPEEAIEGILLSGGIPILAHPSFGSGSQLITGDTMDRRIRYLCDFGLQGLEAFYSGFGPELREELLAFARHYSLFVTAGSDYHGTNKTVRLGDTGLGEESEWPEGLHRFLKAVGRR